LLLNKPSAPYTTTRKTEQQLIESHF